MVRLLIKLEDARSERKSFTTNSRMTKRVLLLLKNQSVNDIIVAT